LFALKGSERWDISHQTLCVSTFEIAGMERGVIAQSFVESFTSFMVLSGAERSCHIHECFVRYKARVGFYSGAKRSSSAGSELFFGQSAHIVMLLLFSFFF
jgi:hypothetical protein